jgi:hypothetical protein
MIQRNAVNIKITTDGTRVTATITDEKGNLEDIIEVNRHHYKKGNETIEESIARVLGVASYYYKTGMYVPGKMNETSQN